MAAIIRAAWLGYNYHLNRSPLITTAVASTFTAGIADIIAQNIISSKFRIRTRTFAIACYGLCWGGPSAHFWHKLMESWFSGESGIKASLAKVLLDQCCFTPVCILLFMAFASAVLEGRSWGFVRCKVEHDFLPLLLHGWKVLPLVSLLNYRVVPLQHRAPLSNIVASSWCLLLLWRARHTPPPTCSPEPSNTRNHNIT